MTWPVPTQNSPSHEKGLAGASRIWLTNGTNKVYKIPPTGKRLLSRAYALGGALPGRPCKSLFGVTKEDKCFPQLRIGCSVMCERF
jgi:hypothetical protein